MASLVIEKRDISRDVFDSLCKGRRIAWDIETSGLDWSSERIGTCQLHGQDTGTIIVQIGQERPELLCSLLTRPDVLKVFHHAPFDLRFMVSHWDVDVRSVACTKVASKMLNANLPHGEHTLQSLLRTWLNVDISKDQRTTNWTAADLSPNQILYAANDVKYLLPLYDKLVGMLNDVALDRLYRSCCDFLPTLIKLDVNGLGDIFAY